jgi:hypothetical protein
MPTYHHPKYPDTEQLILIGDIVVEPHGQNHEKGLYPHVVKDVGHKLITIQSLIDETIKNTYPCLIRPATQEERQKLNDTMSPASIEKWKRDMMAQGVSILWIRDPIDNNKSQRHLVILPDGYTTNDFKVEDLIKPFVPEDMIKHYKQDNVYTSEIGQLKQLYIIEQLILKKPVKITATPMTKLEKAYKLLDKLTYDGAMEGYESEILEQAFQEMAEKLNITLPEREIIAEDDYDYWDEY